MNTKKNNANQLIIISKLNNNLKLNKKFRIK